MRIENLNKHPIKAEHLALLFMLVALLFLFSVPARGQVTFVHLTDPHIFDDDWQDPGNTDPKKREDNRLDNLAVFESCLWHINERIKYGERIDFGVITGDLGIEYLVKDRYIDQRVRTAALDFASVLALSSISRWLIVPGNNDVLCEDPANVRYYQIFVEQVSAALRARGSPVTLDDLTPNGPANYAQSALVEIKGYNFIGFNNATFKNVEADPDNANCARRNRLTENAADQKQYAIQVLNLLRQNDKKFAYIFYHVPEIDDPYFVTLDPLHPKLSSRYANRALIGESFFDSAWFVTKDVRDEWNKVVVNPRVKGLFTGHFHDNKRETYLTFSWLRTKNYPAETLSKLHVAPPLALKLQYDKSARARGFQEVHIDVQGEVSTRFVWFENGSWGLGGRLEEKEIEALRQLELGNSYAANGRLKDAEAAYVKAGESTWAPTRTRAMQSAAKVIGDQESPGQKYLVDPFRAALATGTVTLASVILGLLVVIFVRFYIGAFARAYGEWKGQHKLRIISGAQNEDSFTGAFAEIITMVFGRMRSHYDRSPVVRGQHRVLPMVVGSQVKDIAELIDSTVPEGPAKVIAWVLKKTDSPEYLMVATVQMAQMAPERRWMRPHGGLFIVLHKSGKTLKTWHKTQIYQDLPDQEIRLAFDSFKFLVRHMNR